MAFKALHEAYERMKYSEIDYGIDKFLRLPMYLHAAGKKDIAWKILNNYLRGEYPVIKRRKKSISTSYGSTRNKRQNEGFRT